MSSSKTNWIIRKYAKYIFEDNFPYHEETDETQIMKKSTNGSWKLCSGENNDLLLSYLESDHLLLTKNDVILESFSLLNSRSWLQGIAKGDSLLILCQLRDGDSRRFRIQFASSDAVDGKKLCQECIEILRKHFTIEDRDGENPQVPMEMELTEVNKALLDKINLRKAYAVNVPDENLMDIITVCLTDISFPSYVAKVEKLLTEIGKQDN